MDSPDAPRAIDGNTLAHLAFGFGLGAVLLSVGMDPGAMVGVVAAVAIFWEVVENTFTDAVAWIIGPASYRGDSWINLFSDITVAIAAAALAIVIGPVAAGIVAGVLLVAWLGWACRTSHLPPWVLCGRSKTETQTRLVPMTDFV